MNNSGQPFSIGILSNRGLLETPPFTSPLIENQSQFAPRLRRFRDDVDRLLGVLGRLVERGDTVAVIEHHPDVMLAADWIIDLGPEGGVHGGRVVAQGTPEAIAKRKRSHTGEVLRRELA